MDEMSTSMPNGTMPDTNNAQYAESTLDGDKIEEVMSKQCLEQQNNNAKGFT